jgi:hypothetical protein
MKNNFPSIPIKEVILKDETEPRKILYQCPTYIEVLGLREKGKLKQIKWEDVKSITKYEDIEHEEYSSVETMMSGIKELFDILKSDETENLKIKVTGYYTSTDPVYYLNNELEFMCGVELELSTDDYCYVDVYQKDNVCIAYAYQLIRERVCVEKEFAFKSAKKNLKNEFKTLEVK